ncbi:MAG: hypothetical protein ACRDF5_03690 [bacterium]
MFLAAVSRNVYAHPKSPYLQLLKHAGCEESALRAMVRQHGVEPTLERLRDMGVYLTHEEFKGRVDVRRGGKTFRFSEGDFDNPRQASATEIRTGATRSAGTRVLVRFDYIAGQRAPARRLMLEALGVGDLPIVVWSFSRRAVGMMWWVGLAHTARPAAQWFYIVDPTLEPVSPGHRIMFRAGQAAGLLRGTRLPYPTHAPFADAARVLAAVLRARSRSGGCVVVTTPSAAVRLASLAGDQGEDLVGVTFCLASEPLTPGKAEELRRRGARASSHYAFGEAGAVGCACGHPEAPDDVHLMADAFAMILHRRSIPEGGELDGFMITSLLPSVPKIMLNVETDDFGDVTQRRCHCLFDELGLHSHLASIRSFSKLTGEGMTVLGTDAVRVIEEVLPREFGGRSIDYQILEVEDERRLTQLWLLVSPSVSGVDAQRIANRFLEELRKRPGSSVLWEQAQTIQVVRRDPVQTSGGKLLPFYTLAFTGKPRR